MKSILLSKQPKIVANVIDKKSDILVCKKFPKDFIGWVYVYCTKEKPYLFKDIVSYNTTNDKIINKSILHSILNGKVVARFWCDKVEEIHKYEHYEPECDIGVCVLPAFTCNAYCTETLDHFKLLDKSCLKDLSLASSYHIDELDLYLKGKMGYAIHISKLEIFDRPRELKEVRYIQKPKCKCSNCPCEYEAECKYEIPLTKAPQNYCYIEGDK